MPKVWDDAAIREAFIDDGGQSEYHDPINGAQTQRRVAGGIFDRWLAAHDREVAAKALREAAANWFPHPTLGLARLADDAAELLRAEADRIESSEKGASDGEQ